MSALARVPERPHSLPYAIYVGANGEWIVEGPDDRWGGLFVSQSAAEAFVRREMRAMLVQEPLPATRPNLSIVRLERSAAPEHPHRPRYAPVRTEFSNGPRNVR